MPMLEEVDEEENVKFAVGESLVSRRALKIQIKVDDSKQQRENIFHTRHVNDKICSVINDVYKESLLNFEESNISLPSLVKSLLQDFEDVFLEDVPSGLPPIQGIEHQIDFILGAVIPNRPTYRSKSKETKEIQKYVEKLRSNSYIRESMSPCTMPILLVLKKDQT
ncbi:uncharacterized protein LOC111386006 [Olea europaea var. sylvestris]|uniref:uncharacterized protein LOC111386006 n=1 Tax=Olea europaea var. sylvestris TaxID=158386 RepID=UPI000C1D7FA6|nr:uncharacterized protein LOC111386006 [Olea europaea var. sylvestris]